MALATAKNHHWWTGEEFSFRMIHMWRSLKNQRSWAPLTEGMKSLLPGKEQSQGQPHHSTTYRATTEDGGSHFTRSPSKNTRGKLYKLHWQRLHLNVRKNILQWDLSFIAQPAQGCGGVPITEGFQHGIGQRAGYPHLVSLPCERLGQTIFQGPFQSGLFHEVHSTVILISHKLVSGFMGNFSTHQTASNSIKLPQKDARAQKNPIESVAIFRILCSPSP